MFRLSYTKNEEQVRDVVFECIGIFYNRFRKHAALGYKSPIEFVQEEIQTKQKSRKISSLIINLREFRVRCSKVALSKTLIERVLETTFRVRLHGAPAPSA